jgi:protein-S-isoprenylcysteine O-methyltransferase Ste14
MATEPEKDQVDLMSRGNKDRTVSGRVVFVGLRSLDVILQYGILARGIGAPLLHRVGLETLPAGLASHTGTIIDRLELSPYRLALVGLSFLSALKQNYWILAVAQEDMTVGNGIVIATFNSIHNTLNSLLFTTRLFSASRASGSRFPQVPLVVGSALALVGFVVEAASEEQRKLFKKDPKNKGKAFTGGLFGLARHINYTGYTMWRFGYALAAGGWTWATIVGGFFAYDFTYRAIPILDSYCTRRYGVQWEQYKQAVPYKFIPGVY